MPPTRAFGESDDALLHALRRDIRLHELPHPLHSILQRTLGPKHNNGRHGYVSRECGEVTYYDDGVDHGHVPHLHLHYGGGVC